MPDGNVMTSTARGAARPVLDTATAWVRSPQRHCQRAAKKHAFHEGNAVNNKTRVHGTRGRTRSYVRGYGMSISKSRLWGGSLITIITRKKESTEAHRRAACRSSALKRRILLYYICVPREFRICATVMSVDSLSPSLSLSLQCSSVLTGFLRLETFFPEREMMEDNVLIETCYRLQMRPRGSTLDDDR